jgi:predicted secreted Zn-dependent protease
MIKVTADTARLAGSFDHHNKLVQEALARAIHAHAEKICANAVTGSDGSAPYARIQDYGGRVNIRQASPEAAKAMALEYHGRLLFAKGAAAHITRSLRAGHE